MLHGFICIIIAVILIRIFSSFELLGLISLVNLLVLVVISCCCCYNVVSLCYLALEQKEFSCFSPAPAIVQSRLAFMTLVDD